MNDWDSLHLKEEQLLVADQYTTWSVQLERDLAARGLKEALSPSFVGDKIERAADEQQRSKALLIEGEARYRILSAVAPEHYALTSSTKTAAEAWQGLAVALGGQQVGFAPQNTGSEPDLQDEVFMELLEALESGSTPPEWQSAPRMDQFIFEYGDNLLMVSMRD